MTFPKTLCEAFLRRANVWQVAAGYLLWSCCWWNSKVAAGDPLPPPAVIASGAATAPFVLCGNELGQFPISGCGVKGRSAGGGGGEGVGGDVGGVGGAGGVGGGGGCKTNCTLGDGPNPSPYWPWGPQPPRQDYTNMISPKGSYVHNRFYQYVHWAYDFKDPSGTDHLSILRHFRSRDWGPVAGSFGPSHFMQFDLKVRFDLFNSTNSSGADYQTHFTSGAVLGKLNEGLVSESSFSNTYSGGSFSHSTDQLSEILNERSPFPTLFRRVEMLNSSMQPATCLVGEYGVTGEFVDPKYLRVTLLDGRVLTFEAINTDVYPAPTTGNYQFTDGRIVRYEYPNGKAIDFTYKSFTTAELIADPTLQWQIDTIADGLRSIAVQYKSTQVAGAWVISQLTYPGGRTTAYSYNDNSLTTVTHADGTQSTFTYSIGPNGFLKLAINDPVADPMHRKKDIWHSGLSSTVNGNIVVTSIGHTRVVGSGANETVYASLSVNAEVEGEPSPYDNSYAAIYEGGGVLQTPERVYNIRRYFESWSLDTSNTSSIDIINKVKEPTYDAAVVGSTLGAAGHTITYSAPTNSGAAGLVIYQDNTFEAYCYISGSDRIKRYRDRSGNVTRYTYDSSERLIQQEEGLRDHPSNIPSMDPYSGFNALYYNRCPTNDVQTDDYASTTFEYYGSGVAGAGLRKADIDTRGNRTDYEYNNAGMITKIIRPSDTSGGTRPATLYAYDTAGRLSTITDPEGRVVTRTYDVMDRLTQITYGDGTSDHMIYGTSTAGSSAGLLVKTIDRLGVVTTYAYDGADRLITKVTAAAKLDSNNSEVATPELAVTETFTYINGTPRVDQHTRAGAKTQYVYDYRGRVIETHSFPRSGVELVTKRSYLNNQLHYTEDPYGRRTYYGYDAANGRVIRTVQFTIPGQSLATNVAVLSLVRDTSANAIAIVTDLINNGNGQPTQRIDPRSTTTQIVYDSRGRTKEQIAALGTSVESKTETLYDTASNVIEVRSPRYFDTGDTYGSTKAREQWTYTGRNLVATHTEAPGASEAATESFTYTLSGRRATQVDFRGNTWTTTESGCCALTRTSIDPLGHGTITNANSKGQVVHTATVSDVTTHSSNYNNPVDAKTLSETTTRYDGRGRPSYQTTWLSPRGLVDTANPSIAGLNGVSASDGLTTQYLYDDNLTDGVGLDNSTGLSFPKLGTGASGTSTVTLSTALTKLADTQANGGAGISFSSSQGAAGSASVVISPEDEVSFSIRDAAGRTVMSGKLNNYKGSGSTAANTLASWSCQLNDATQSLSGYGTVLETRSIDSLGYASKTWTDAAGRTMKSFDQLDKATVFTYDASGNQLSVRDPNSVGADMLYDALGRNTQRTDTFGDVTKTDYDRAGNAIKQTDAKNHYTLISFDARSRRKSTTDRISAGTTFTYLATGQLASLTDAESQVTSYTYDTRGSKLTEQYPDHTTSTSPGNTGYGIVTFVYDNAGRMLRKQDQAGDTCTYNYDLAGRMTKRDYRTLANSPSGTIADSDTFTFDRAGRMLTAISGRYTNTVGYAYDLIGRKISESLTIASQTYTVGSGFNTRNELTQLTYPDSSVAERSYDARGALYQLRLDGSTIDTRSYDDGGRVASEVLGNGITETRAYRTDNLLSSISYSNTNIGNLTYSWDANKNKTAETISGVMSGYGFSASGTTYDFEDRLTAFSRGNGTMTQSWNLTPVGDWTSVTTNGTAQSRTHGPTHELISAGGQSLDTDVKGNMRKLPSSNGIGLPQLHVGGINTGTSVLRWDIDNRLDRVTGTTVQAPISTVHISFFYDALGRRLGRNQAITGAKRNLYIYAGQQVLAEYQVVGSSGSFGPPSSPTYRNVYGSYIDEPVARKSLGIAGNIVFFHRNQQYSVYALSNSSGTVIERYTYSAYGAPIILSASGAIQQSSLAENRYTFTGREWDPMLGLYYFRARWMSPIAGRFCSRDPIGFEGSKWNIYEYCRGGSLFRTDPTGKFFGFSYGNYCGFLTRGPGKPIDSLDEACRLHDECLATFEVIIKQPCRLGGCHQNLCHAAYNSANFQCKKDHATPASVAKCIQAADQVLAACGALNPMGPIIPSPANPYPQIPDNDGDGLPNPIDPFPDKADGDGDGIPDTRDPYPHSK